MFGGAGGRILPQHRVTGNTVTMMKGPSGPLWPAQTYKLSNVCYEPKWIGCPGPQLAYASYRRQVQAGCLYQCFPTLQCWLCWHPGGHQRQPGP